MSKDIAILLALILLVVPVFSQEELSDEENLRRIADGIIEENVRGFIDNKTGQIYYEVSEIPAGRDLSLISEYSASHYPEGVINIGMMDLGELLGEKKYTDYTTENIKFIFDNAGYFKDILNEENHWCLPFASIFVINYLDDCGAMGASIIDAYEQSKNEAYLPYIEKVADFISTKQYRLDDGTLVRNRPVEMSLWADDLYMSVPFLARMGALTGEGKYFADAIKQVKQFTQYLWDEQTRLYFHSWHSDEGENGVAHWGRANGWIMMAQVELLKYLPEDHPQREELLNIFRRQIRGVARYQSSTGLWHQLLDRVDSYEETSCTAMFTYGIAYAVNEGILPERYISIAQDGWKGILSKTDKDYRSSAVNGICIGTGIESDMKHYYTRPTRANEVGLGAVISAGVEILRYNKNQKK